MSLYNSYAESSPTLNLAVIAEKLLQRQSRPGLRFQSVKSPFLAATALFWLLNYLVGATADFREETTWWHSAKTSINQLDNLKKHPSNVVFMGSSMMRSPLWCVDKAVEPDIPPFSDYHSAVYFEHEISRTGLNPVKAVNLAVDGSSVSDNYLLFEKLISGSQRPSVVVWGISPRDFVTSWFFPETATPIFKMVCNPLDFVHVGHLLSTNPLEWLDGYLKTLISLPRLQPRFAASFADLYSNSPTKAIRIALPNTPQMAYQRNKFEQEAVLQFFSASNLRSKMIHYDNQKRCLQQCLKLASAKGVHVLLIDMPVRPGHNLTIAKSVLADYPHFLNELQRQNIDVLNFGNARQQFSSDCFMDDLHLNAKGGFQLIRLLVDYLDRNKILGRTQI